MRVGTRRAFVAAAAGSVGVAAGAAIWPATASIGPEVGNGRHRCPPLGWLRVRGLLLPVVAIDRLEVPRLPAIPPIETLGALTRTSRATLLLLFGDLSDREAIIRDIESQLRLLNLRLAR